MPRGDYVLVTHPDKQPAVDFLTRSGAGPFVDTGVDVTMRTRPGDPVKIERVYLAVATIRALAQVAGVGGDPAVNNVRDAELIARGKMEGLIEDHGNDVVRLAESLGRIVRAAGLDGPGNLGASTL